MCHLISRIADTQENMSSSAQSGTAPNLDHYLEGSCAWPHQTQPADRHNTATGGEAGPLKMWVKKEINRHGKIATLSQTDTVSSNNSM